MTHETPPLEPTETPEIRGLAILPPRQRETPTEEPWLALPPIRPEEPVQSLRVAISEVVAYAHITNYRLEVETAISENCGKPDASRLWTTRETVVSVPSRLIDGQVEVNPTVPPTVLEEFADLQGVPDNTGIRMVLERYDVAAVNFHVRRVQSLLDGNAPVVLAVYEKDPPVLEKKKEDNKPRSNKLQDVPLIDGNNLADFFYLASGEDPKIFHDPPKMSKKKKDKTPPDEVTVKNLLVRLNQLENAVFVPCAIHFSDYCPPPSSRKLLGDLAYLEVTFGREKICVTACTLGFYVNRTTDTKFDPSPAKNAHYAHSLLDCLVQASPGIHRAWTKAVDAALERQEVVKQLDQKRVSGLFRTAVRGDFDGFDDPSVAYRASLTDSLMPSWLVSLPKKFKPDWTRNYFHSAISLRNDDDPSKIFGVDLRNGSSRDWNEELQMAREMPTDTFIGRIERARVLYKVFSEFGEAALFAIQAIVDGHVLPMNPNEPRRGQVYLHNSIFVSRAVDNGPETFKLHRGDKAARKSANRDNQCISTFYRMDSSDIHTLATVLIDYLGNRWVCQSLPPGILSGERSHTLKYGTVDAGKPLKYDKELHSKLEDTIGKQLFMATRPVFRQPLIDPPPIKNYDIPGMPKRKEEEEEKLDPDEVIQTCFPIEAKGIVGSDKRTYLLDFGRFTPRDPNWIPKDQGGTGKWEGVPSSAPVPVSLEDDEWTCALLRPELVTNFVRYRYQRFVQAKRKKEEESDKANGNADKKEESDGKSAKEKSLEEKEMEAKEEAERQEFFASMRMNVNAFLPGVRSVASVNEESSEQAQKDEALIRDAASFLWDEILPKIEESIRSTNLVMPLDGAGLTECLHRNGVNCRYLGRLAQLAIKQEEVDAKADAELQAKRLAVISQTKLPKSWLPLLECEIVARAAKHVLDGYLAEDAFNASAQSAQTVAAFLSALVSESEERSDQTESRLKRRPDHEPDADEFSLLTISGIGEDGDAIPSRMRDRAAIWQDIELEVARRFRYILTLYNRGNKLGRALHAQLLRRVCQRNGIRLVAKMYQLGGRCMCGAGASDGRLSAVYPISPLDVVDISPMMKHAAAHNEGFSACVIAPIIQLPAVTVFLPDARLAFEMANRHASAQKLNKAVELAQEAISLYQRVTDSAAHPGIMLGMELISNIFFEAGELEHAAAHASKALALSTQTFGFDSRNTVSAHLILFQTYARGKEFQIAAKHMQAVIYLVELMGGPQHLDLFQHYQKLAGIYSQDERDTRSVEIACRLLRESFDRDCNDRLVYGVSSTSYAKLLAKLGDYKDALEAEKIANETLKIFFDGQHNLIKQSNADLEHLTKLAKEKGNSRNNNERLKEETAEAEAMAAELLAEEEREKKRTAKKKKGKK